MARVDSITVEDGRISSTSNSSVEEVEAEEALFQTFRGILKNLTQQKFEICAEQALSMRIDSEEQLAGCADIMLTMVLENPSCTVDYANLCKVMSTIKVDVATEEGKPKVVTFRRVLLTKCQQEFEKDKKDDEDREKMLAAIKDTEDADKKKQLEDELFVLETKNRKRSLGNIRFIGELFKSQMLSETIMHECIVRLLRSSSDEKSLECFAGLITTTGKDLDKPEAKAQMDSYFKRIAEIIKKGRIPARIKFMLQDVQKLRGNSWVPCVCKKQSRKTIDQQGRLPLHRMNRPPLLMGPNTRAPTIFPQHIGVVPQPITLQQNIAMAAAAASGLPPQFYAMHAPQQAQFAINQPINLGMTGVNPPQQISTGMHTMPPSGLMTPSVNTVTSSQVPGLNADSQLFRPSGRSQPPPNNL